MQINPSALRAIREYAGLTQVDLALQAGVNRTHLVNIEKGRGGAGPDTIKRLAQALKVPIPAIINAPDDEDDG